MLQIKLYVPNETYPLIIGNKLSKKHSKFFLELFWTNLLRVSLEFSFTVVQDINLGGHKCESSFLEFNGQKFALWEFRFQIFVEGILYYSWWAPTRGWTLEAKNKWKIKNVHIFTWILNFIASNISLKSWIFQNWCNSVVASWRILLSSW